MYGFGEVGGAELRKENAVVGDDEWHGGTTTWLGHVAEPYSRISVINRIHNPILHKSG
jgi:hypothetical protein